MTDCMSTLIVPPVAACFAPAADAVPPKIASAATETATSAIHSFLLKRCSFRVMPTLGETRREDGEIVTKLLFSTRTNDWWAPSGARRPPDAMPYLRVIAAKSTPYTLLYVKSPRCFETKRRLFALERAAHGAPFCMRLTSRLP